MSPIAGKRDVLSFEELVNNGWDGFDLLEKAGLRPPKNGYEPTAEVAQMAYALTLNAQTASFLEWIMDITLRQPLRLPDAGFEQAALAYAVRRGVNGVAEAILAAIEMGRKLQEANNAASQQTSE